MSVPQPSDRITARSVDEVVAAVQSHPHLRVVGNGTKARWRLPSISETTTLDLASLSGVVSFDPADQVITVRAGTSLSELQSALAEASQCLPLGSWPPNGTVGGSIAMNLPHTLEFEAGGWRDWVLGLTAVTSEGEVVKAGSRVVKSVAGYDLHKFLVGSRGTLAVIVEVTLRTTPLSARPKEILEGYGALATVNLIHRVRPSDIKSATRGYPDSRWDPRSGTIWATVPEDWTFQRFPGDWMIRADVGTRNFVIEDATQARLMARTKAIFDPTHRLEPDALPTLL